MIKIGIVDDNRQTLNSLKEMLNYHNEIEVVITETDGAKYLESMKDLNLEKHPQVVLMDIDMKELNGIETIKISKLKFPDIKYIMLTVFDDEEKLFESIKAGASGYLLKDEKIPLIIEHIKNLVEFGFTPMSPMIAKKTFNLLSRAEMEEKRNEGRNNISEALTERESEVLQYLMDGHSYKHIAEKLFISVNTAKKHIGKIYEKLHVSNKAQMISLVTKM